MPLQVMGIDCETRCANYDTFLHVQPAACGKSPAFSFGSFGEAHWVCKSESWVQNFNTLISLPLQMTVRNDMGGPTWVASMHGTNPI